MTAERIPEKPNLLASLGSKSQPVVITSLIGLISYLILVITDANKNKSPDVIGPKVYVLEERMRSQEILLEKISIKTEKIYNFLVRKGLD